MKSQTTIHLPLPLFKEGKVRLVYEVGSELLIVTTDRVSAFDVILNEGIPEKGAVLTGISDYWFSQLAPITAHHCISTDVDTFPSVLHPFKALLAGRSMLVHKTVLIPVECVVRGYMAGSAWAEYQDSQTIAGVSMPPGLQLADPLPTPIFTPAIKNDAGHDENISFETLRTLIGDTLAETLKNLSLRIYNFAHAEMRKKGLILADTKFEFGQKEGKLLLIDEVLTPDSSRYWDAETYRPGISPPSYDKQIIRDYLQGLPWDKTPPAPPLPPEIIAKTSACYKTLYKRLVG